MRKRHEGFFFRVFLTFVLFVFQEITPLQDRPKIGTRKDEMRKRHEGFFFRVFLTFVPFVFKN
jgi:hypothetical protein